MRFRTTILQGGGTTTGIPVPDHVVAALGGGRRAPVRVTVGGHTYRTTLATRDGRAILSLSAENRTAAGVVGGQDVEVEVVLDTEPRVVEVPEDVAAALAVRPGATEAFDRLPWSHRKEHVRAVEEAKKPETRARRITALVDAVAPRERE